MKTGTKVTGAAVNGGKATLTVEPRRAARRRRSRPTPSSSRSAAVPTPKASARQGRHRAQQAGPDRDRPRLPHQRAEHLGDRRRHPRPDACPQGRGRGHCRGGKHRRADRHRQPRGDPLGGLHPPRIAGVGLCEEQAKEAGHAIKVGKFPFMANSRAETNRDTDGFVKVIADAKNDRVLGVWMIGSLAGTMIAQAARRWSSARRRKTSPTPATPTRPTPKRLRKRRWRFRASRSTSDPARNSVQLTFI